jgi:hypothetical protein
MHLTDEVGILHVVIAGDLVQLKPPAEGDESVVPRLATELGDEKAERDGDFHGLAGHALGHVADGNAVAELAERSQVGDHAIPLQVSDAIIVDGHDDLVGEHGASGDRRLSALTSSRYWLKT